MVIFLFSTKNTLFVQIWSTKTRVVSLSWNLVSRLIRLCRIHWWCSLLQFLTGNIFFGDKFGPKNQNCQFKLIFGNYTNLHMHNSVWCSLSQIWCKISKLSIQAEILCLYYSNSSMKDSMMMFTFCSFWPEGFFFCGKFVPKNQNYLLKVKFRT